MTEPDPFAIDVNTPYHTDLLADTDLFIRQAASEIDAALAAGYQFGFFRGSVKVYDNSGTVGITVPGLNTIAGAIGSVHASSGSYAPCLFTIASYNAGGPGTVYGQVWNWPFGATVYGPVVPPSTIAPLVRQLQPMWPSPINTQFDMCVIAWGTVL